MILATSAWRTTSSGPKRVKPIPSTPRRIRSASTSPDITPRGRSIWVVSPVTAMRLPSHTVLGGEKFFQGDERRLIVGTPFPSLGHGRQPGPLPRLHRRPAEHD